MVYKIKGTAAAVEVNVNNLKGYVKKCGKGYADFDKFFDGHKVTNKFKESLFEKLSDSALMNIVGTDVETAQEAITEVVKNDEFVGVYLWLDILAEIIKAEGKKCVILRNAEKVDKKISLY